MTQAGQLAAFIGQASFNDISEEARNALKCRVLDSLGCAIGALGGEPIAFLRDHIDDFGGAERCALIGGGRTAPDRAALYNSALIRYLDFNDTYLAKGESCHPSDNLGAVLAAAEYAGRSGPELLTALAVGYQVQCRLSDVAPVRARGFDHVTQLAYGVSAGASSALDLNKAQTANAVAIGGTAFNALRVTRTGLLSHWKGLAAANTAFCGTHAAFLAMRGITGPPEVFEGNKGFKESIAGSFEIDWSRENLERVTRTSIKKYNAEFHSQSTLEGILELREEGAFRPEDVARVEIETFDVAFHIIGGGEEGDKTIVATKEEADHSLPYMAAVAILDGRVMPEQYSPERIRREDVQNLLRRIKVRPVEDYSRRFPDEMPCRIIITLQNGRGVVREKRDFEGFFTRPMSWEAVVRKFEGLSGPYTDASLRRDLVNTVADLENLRVADLTKLFPRIKQPGQNDKQ